MTLVSAGNNVFKNYGEGVISKCGEDDPVDHAVVLVGVKFESRRRLLELKGKNSWGAGWGKEGYFWIKDGACNICEESYWY